MRQWRHISLGLAFVGIYTLSVGVRNTGFSSSTKLQLPSLAASELPGYTGWARPASTLAGQFRVKCQDGRGSIHQDWTVTVTCDGKCSSSSSFPNQTPKFFARAYGPAILSGVIERLHGEADDFLVTFHPVVPGQYTIEVVLEYSHSLDPDSFPLSKEQLPPPYYEGYLLNGFPLQMDTVYSSDKKYRKVGCSVNDLDAVAGEASSDPPWKRASWRVVSTNKHPGTRINGAESVSNVTLRGYQAGRNSIGFVAAYEPSNCDLGRDLSEILTMFPCAAASKKIRIILIGDSVMRLQQAWLEQQLPAEIVEVTFMELYGGALRCARLSGPNVTQLQIEPVANSSRTVVIYNSGMHDIHRLCGHSWSDDRLLYLSPEEQKQSCTTLYQKAIRELTLEVLRIPAAAHIFQTTTAAWPKYGNFGVAWDPRHAQELPLDALFAERFNKIAVSEIRNLNESPLFPLNTTIIDAYWITLARPDNRETNQKSDIGKKLSHPGVEVVQYMVILWWQAAVQLLCQR